MNEVRQRPSIKNEFIAACSTGLVVKIEIPPVINDTIHKVILSNPGQKIVWTPEAISYMSNIAQTGEASSVKLKVEDYIKQAN